MSNPNTLYTSVEIVDDDTNGLVELGIVERQDDTRKTKLRNNFIGLLGPADVDVAQKLAELLAGKIGDVDETVVVGMHKSGIVAATLLGIARESAYAWTTPDSIGANGITYFEDHRPDKAHHLYGISPDSRVLLVEDEVTSGKGIAGLASELRAHNIGVVAIASFIETINFDGRGYIRETTGLELTSLVQVRLS